MKNEKSFTLRLTESQLETINKLAELEERSSSSIVRRLIDDARKRINTKKTKRIIEV